MIRISFLFVAIFALSKAHPHHAGTNNKGIKLNTRIIPSTDNVRNLPEDRDIFEINKDIDTDIFDGDILRTHETKSTIIDKSYYWDTYAIPVTYSPELGLLARAAIDDARQEYELRTCFMYPYLKDEPNFIYYAPLSGCYSSIGMQGGNQTISTGSGCERVGSIQHEMMHALGIYHEQSRTDRDDYIKIMWSNLYPSTAGNFAKYNYNITNPRRVPYDYNSVMHYSDMGFSKNGEPTIVTIDPAFQDVIGQRRTFSPGDVTKITRMYGCSDTLRISYSCNFEQQEICGYAQHDVEDNVDWHLWDNMNPDTSHINNKILPAHDATFGINGLGSYILLDTSSFAFTNYLGNIKSMRFKSTVNTQCLEFSFYIELNSASTASLAVYLASIDSTNGDIVSTGNPIMTLDSNNNGPKWQTRQLSINAPSEYKLVFVGKTGGFVNDIIAIDDVSVVDKKCSNNMFTIEDYRLVEDELGLGSGIRVGPLYTAEPGYAYVIDVYPDGMDVLDRGYVSMYFKIVQGDYDDQLAWPFNNQYIKMKIVDQGPISLERMSQFSNFLAVAEQFPGDFDKPNAAAIHEIGGGVGYPKFMPKSDLETRAFLKLDRLMVEVEVRDMNGFEGSTGYTASVELLADKDQSQSAQTSSNTKSLTRDNDHDDFEDILDDHNEHDDDHDDDDHDDDDHDDHDHDDDDHDDDDHDDDDHDDDDHDDDDHDDDDHDHIVKRTKPEPPTTTRITSTTKSATATTSTTTRTTITRKPEQDLPDGMVTYAMTAFITLMACLFVFIVMSIVTCVVANSYKKKTRIIMRQY